LKKRSLEYDRRELQKISSKAMPKYDRAGD
jgi:hypothetical protein